MNLEEATEKITKELVKWSSVPYPTGFTEYISSILNQYAASEVVTALEMVEVNISGSDCESKEATDAVKFLDSLWRSKIQEVLKKWKE